MLEYLKADKTTVDYGFRSAHISLPGEPQTRPRRRSRLFLAILQSGEAARSVLKCLLVATQLPTRRIRVVNGERSDRPAIAIRHSLLALCRQRRQSSHVQPAGRRVSVSPLPFYRR